MSYMFGVNFGWNLRLCWCIGIVILDPKDMEVDPNDIRAVKNHIKSMGESPRKRLVHWLKGGRLSVPWYFKYKEDEDVTDEIIDISKKICEDVNKKVAGKIFYTVFYWDEKR